MIAVTDITQKIKSLSRFEKLQLIEEISKMLREEESPSKYFSPESVYPIFTPLHQEKAAGQLQEFLEKRRS